MPTLQNFDATRSSFLRRLALNTLFRPWKPFPGRPFLTGTLLLWAVFTAACEPTVSSPPAAPTLEPVTLDDTVTLASGQTLYVPVYSHIYMVQEGRTINLTTTLSIRNTDRAQPMILTAVDYYDSQGNLVSNYLENPAQIDPLASAEFVVPQEDTSGGIGASFLVEWGCPNRTF